MSISSSLSNALSGLTAASRGAEVISSNVANALTDGYGARDISLSARFGGGIGGVAVVGETRNVDQGLLSERRLADAAFGQADLHADFFAKAEALLGLPGEAGQVLRLLSVVLVKFLKPSKTRGSRQIKQLPIKSHS